MPPAAVPPELAGHPQYADVTELGRGGMGVVYLAKNVLMDRPEVLKVLTRDAAVLSSAGDRFLREIRAAAKLQHPNVVVAYSALQLGGLLVFAMEYVPGDDLAKAVDDRGPLPVPEACYYAYQAALGLQHAHEKGMVHRDIKPSNLILHRDGRRRTVKILDFGLAKANREKALEAGLTGAGQLLGTPDYMAPEQTVDAAKADIRADVYSLGCTLFFLLTGRPPFAATNLFELMAAHQVQAPVPPHQLRPDVPPELSGVVARMMAKNPADRFQTPGDAAKALMPFVKADSPDRSGETQTSRPEAASRPETAVRPETVLTAEVVSKPEKPKHWQPPSVFRNMPVPMDTKHLNPEDFAPPERDAAKKPRKAKTKPKAAAKKVRAVWLAAGGVAVLGGAGAVLFAFDRPKPVPAGPPTTSPEVASVTPRIISVPKDLAPIASPADSFVPLFNGKDLAGWKTHPDQPGKWSVENGVLKGKDDVSHLYTERADFTDVHIRAEVRHKPGSNGGIVARAGFGPPEKGALSPRGYTAQLDADGQKQPKTGSLFADSVTAVRLDSPAVGADTWFVLEVIVRGNRVRVLVDGKETADFEDPIPRKHSGHLALQIGTAGSAIEFRKVEARRLPAPASNPAYGVPSGRENAKPAEFLAVHGYSTSLLKGWAGSLPAGYRPVWVAARTGTPKVLFDAVAAPVSDTFAWELKVYENLSEVGPDYDTMIGRGYRVRQIAPHLTGEARLWVEKKHVDGSTWHGPWNFVRGKLEANAATGRVTSLSASARGSGVLYNVTHRYDGPSPRWEAVPATQIESLTVAVAEYRQKGWRPAHVSTHVDREPLYYIAHFEENRAGVTWQFTPWLTTADFDAALSDFKKAGLRPQCVSSVVKDDEVRFTVVWSDEKP